MKTKLLLLLVLSSSLPALAQITESPNPATVLQSDMHREGSNIGLTSYYGSGEIYKNYACVNNCGFEPNLAQQIYALTTAGTSTTFTGTNQYDLGNGAYGNMDGFNIWAGAQVCVPESQNAEQGTTPNAKGQCTTISGNQGSISASSCTFSGSSSPYTVTCSVDNNPTTAGFAVGQVLNWEFPASGSGYTSGYQCCTISAMTSSTVSWTQTATPSGTAAGGYLGNNVAKTYTVSPALTGGASFAVGDTVIYKKTYPVTAANTWNGYQGSYIPGVWLANSGGGTIFGATTSGGYTLCSGCGAQSFGTTVSNSGDVAGATIYVDNVANSSPTDRFTNFNGTYTFSFDAQLASGSTPKLYVSVGRGSNCTSNITTGITSTWSHQTVSCTFAESGSTGGNFSMSVQNVYNGAANTILLDNYSLVKTGGDSTNTSVFTDGFVQAQRDRCASTNPTARCTIRNWTNQNQETFASWVGPVTSTLQAGLNPGAGGQGVKLKDYLDLVQEIPNADPYISLPITMTPADAALVEEFILGSSSTTGGAVRASLGRSAPYSFTNIYLSIGNETWNGGSFLYQSLPQRSSTPAVPNCSLPSSNPELYYDYSLYARDVIAAMRADATYNASVIKLGFDGFTSNVAGIECALARSKPDYVEFNHYKLSSVSDAPNKWASAWVEPEIDTTSPGGPTNWYSSVSLVEGLNVCGSAGTAACKVTSYETANATLKTCGNGYSPSCGGSAVVLTQTGEDEITAGAGAGLPEVEGFLRDCQVFGVCVENYFAATEFSNAALGSGLTAKLWGDVIDYGGAMSYYNSVPYVMRPSGLGTVVMNQGIVGPMIANTLTGSGTHTWAGNEYNGTIQNSSYSSVTGTPALSAAVPDVRSYAFGSGSTFGRVYTNVSATTYTVACTGSYCPTGSVAYAHWDTSSPDTLCEAPTGSSNVAQTGCAIATSTLTNPSSISVPPGVTSISYTTGGSTPTAATPTFSVAAGSYGPSQSVSIATATSGASIYYTTNGSTPTSASSLYSSAITVSSSETLSAIAVESGYTNSAVATAAYVINGAASTPAFSPAAGTYSSAQTVTASDSTSGATIYCTTDGTTPTTSSNVYSSAFSVPSSATIKCVALAASYSLSAIGTAAYTISIPVAAAPGIAPAAGSYTSTQTIILSSSTAGATIYYTTNGTTPTTSSTVYSAPFTVSASSTVQAIAVASGYTTSSTTSAAYSIASSSGTVGTTIGSGTTLGPGTTIQPQ